MKSFRERNPIIVGAISLAVVGATTVGALNYSKLPFISSGSTYSAYFEEVGDLSTGAPVQVSGLRSGQVKDISLTPRGVLITFTVADNIRLGERTEASIKSKSLLGTKVFEVTPRGSGHLSAAIPVERTTSPFQLPDALGDLTATISGLNTTQLSDALQTLSDTLQDTPPQLRVAVDGVARFSQTIDRRDAELRNLLSNASKATTVLAERTDEIVQLLHDTNAVLAALQSQSAALDNISGNVSALAQQLHGFISDNRTTLKPALDKLNGVLATVDNRKDQIQQSIKGLNSYALSLGESLSGGPFFKVYVANLLPGQFLQPFVDAAFSDLGLDPNVLLPSQRIDPPTGQPGTPALPVPYPRTGQGGEPNLSLPEAITGNPGDPRYPYREPLPAPAPGGPPPGPPVQQAPDPNASTPPNPSAVLVPTPGELAPTTPPAEGAGQ
ncbi:MAG: phospholipid/cholesterol/gamma-HCH transport system substrate-binding protein [Mycobacterium sp.]|nr:phospholipid/cholesterol/gamma-HCH transport system substrate-binding protein [Mycobacterium sp.]